MGHNEITALPIHFPEDRSKWSEMRELLGEFGLDPDANGVLELNRDVAERLDPASLKLLGTVDALDLETLHQLTGPGKAGVAGKTLRGAVETLLTSALAAGDAGAEVSPDLLSRMVVKLNRVALDLPEMIANYDTLPPADRTLLLDGLRVYWSGRAAVDHVVWGGQAPALGEAVLAECKKLSASDASLVEAIALLLPESGIDLGRKAQTLGDELKQLRDRWRAGFAPDDREGLREFFMEVSTFRHEVQAEVARDSATVDKLREEAANNGPRAELAKALGDNPFFRELDHQSRIEAVASSLVFTVADRWLSADPAYQAIEAERTRWWALTEHLGHADRANGVGWDALSQVRHGPGHVEGYGQMLTEARSAYEAARDSGNQDEEKRLLGQIKSLSTSLAMKEDAIEKLPRRWTELWNEAVDAFEQKVQALPNGDQAELSLGDLRFSPADQAHIVSLAKTAEGADAMEALWQTRENRIAEIADRLGSNIRDARTRSEAVMDAAIDAMVEEASAN